MFHHLAAEDYQDATRALQDATRALPATAGAGRHRSSEIQDTAWRYGVVKYTKEHAVELGADPERSWEMIIAHLKRCLSLPARRPAPSSTSGPLT